MSYVIPEIIIPLIIMFALGLLLGWLLWRWRRTWISTEEWETTHKQYNTLADEKSRLEAANAELRSSNEALHDKVASANASLADSEAQLANANARAHASSKEIANLRDSYASSVDKLSAAKQQLAGLSTGAAAGATAATASHRLGFAGSNASKNATAEETEELQKSIDSNLQMIDGVGPKLETFLLDHGVKSLTDVAAWTDADIARLSAEMGPPERIVSQDWVGQAKRILGGEVTKVEVPMSQWDDLKIVKGIGPVLERWLHGRGIFTFAALAALSDSEIDALDHKLEDFPGRIKREEWVPQARQIVAGR